MCLTDLDITETETETENAPGVAWGKYAGVAWGQLDLQEDEEEAVEAAR